MVILGTEGQLHGIVRLLHPIVFDSGSLPGFVRFGQIGLSIDLFNDGLIQSSLQETDE